MMLKYWKEITIAVLLAILVFANNQYDEVQKQLDIEITKNSKVRVDTVTVEKIVEVRKDGTKVIIDRTVDTKKEATEEVKEVEKLVEIKKDTKNYYSVGLSHPVTSKFDVRLLEVEAGMRIFKTDLWGTVGYQQDNNIVTLGVRYEF